MALHRGGQSLTWLALLTLQDLRGASTLRSQTYASCGLGVLDISFIAEMVRYNKSLQFLKLDNNAGVTESTVQYVPPWGSLSYPVSESSRDVTLCALPQAAW